MLETQARKHPRVSGPEGASRGPVEGLQAQIPTEDGQVTKSCESGQR